MNIAFYAPLKPPDHVRPSGDRTVARMLMRALRVAGHQVSLASRLRSLERCGDARAQAGIRRRGEAIAARLAERYARLPSEQRPQLWFTYHLYHRAPDWLGPPLSRALGIPYVVAEASHAPKQDGGPWDEGYRAAARALRSAAAVIVLNPADEPCLRALLGADARIWRLPPFIDARRSVARAGARAADNTVPRLVTVAMMRTGAKLASYRVLADAMTRLRGRAWTLDVVGDGPARGEVEAAFASLAARVRFRGQVDARALPPLLAGFDLHLWPAVNEAWGMAFLETAAAAVPSVAGDSGGVGTIVRDGETGLLAPVGDGPAFARAIERLLDDPALRVRLGEAARARLLAEHDLSTAAARLGRIVDAAAAAAAAAA